MKPTVSDKNLRDAVVNELASDPEVIATHISVTAIDGAITLRGHVMSIHEKHVAVRAAERVDAVKAVADDIEVREPSLHERADDEIAEQIAHLRSAGGPIPDPVAVQVRDSETPPRAPSVISPGCVSSTTCSRSSRRASRPPPTSSFAFTRRSRTPPISMPALSE